MILNRLFGTRLSHLKPGAIFTPYGTLKNKLIFTVRQAKPIDQDQVLISHQIVKNSSGELVKVPVKPQARQGDWELYVDAFDKPANRYEDGVMEVKKTWWGGVRMLDGSRLKLLKKSPLSGIMGLFRRLFGMESEDVGRVPWWEAALGVK